MDESLKFRLEVAERHLALVQGFFPRIDGKVTALFAILSGQVGIAAINITAADLRSWGVVIPAILFSVCALCVMWNLYRCSYPHLTGGERSLVYFGEVAKRTQLQYLTEYPSAQVEELLMDFTKQIWRNSEIVSTKFRYLKYSTVTAMISLLPWAWLLAAVSIANGKLPVFSA